MNGRIVMIATLAIALTGCSRGVLESTSNVSMTVEDRRSTPRRFWVTLVDQQSGARYEQVRVGSKRCRRGPTRLQPGQTILVAVDTYRDEKTGERSRYLDRQNLRSRFC
jgi:hypothetical protein